jgi:hypothetical protein
MGWAKNAQSGCDSNRGQLKPSLKSTRCFSLGFDALLSLSHVYSKYLFLLYLLFLRGHQSSSHGVESMTNGIKPAHLSADERLDEIADLLAAGLMRLKSRQSTPLSPDGGDSSLDCAAHQSSHADRGSLEVEA